MKLCKEGLICLVLEARIRSIQKMPYQKRRKVTLEDWRILPFEAAIHRAGVGKLYENVFAYDAPHNEPGLVIASKEKADDGLFFVAESATREVLGTVMAGYDGHRGWIYCLAVVPDFQRIGIGRELVAHAEEALAARGCGKINLQIVEGNASVEAFYRKLGFETEKRISMGKRLGSQ